MAPGDYKPLFNGERIFTTYPAVAVSPSPEPVAASWRIEVRTHGRKPYRVVNGEGVQLTLARFKTQAKAQEFIDVNYDWQARRMWKPL